MNLLKRFFMCVSICLVSLLVLAGCSIAAHNPNLSIENDRVMYVGQTYDLVVTVENGSASDVEWAADNKDVAMIEGNKITILAEGYFNLVATLGKEKTVKHITTVNSTVYYISYDLNGGVCEGLTDSFDEFTENILLLLPSKTGYTFAGWYTNSVFNGDPVVEVDTSVGHDVHYYAKWNVVNYPISYELNGATCEGLPESRTIEDPEFVLPQLSKTGYNFLGWYDNADFDGAPVTKLDASNLQIEKLYAKFSTELYAITYELGGGEVEDAKYEFSCEEEVVLPIASRYGYEFQGWLIEGESATTIPAGTDHAVTVTAVWEVKSYAIEFELDGGVLEGLPESRTIEDEPIVLGAPVKEGYTFEGWYENAQFEGEAVTELNADNLTIAKLYAKFEEVLTVHIGEVGYKTIAAAIEAAQDGDTIVVDAGSYAEALVVNKAIVLQGEGDETVITEAMEIAADGVTIKAVKFDGNATITLSANNTTLDSISLVSNKYSSTGISGRTSQIVCSKNITGLHIKDSYFLVHGAEAKDVMASDKSVGNFLVENSVFESAYATANYNEVFRLNTITGTIQLINNRMTFDTNNYLLFFGNSANTATLIEIVNNTLEATEGKSTSGIAVRRLPANCIYNFEHNYVNRMTGNILDVNYAAAGSTTNVVYNFFEKAFKFTNQGSGTKYYEGNCFAAAQTTVTPDYQAYEDYNEEQMEVAYLAFLHPTISYDLDGGHWGAEEGITELTRGVEYVLPNPQKDGFAFAGWYDGDNKVTSCYNKSYTLVAHWSKEYPAHIGEQGYDSFGEAYDAAQAGDTIKLGAGEHTLNFVLNKSITVEGLGKEQTIVVITADVAGNLAASDVTFKNLWLKGKNGGGAGIVGVYFQATGNAKNFTCDNCKISGMNTFIKFINTVNNDMIINIKDCDVNEIGQFFMWVTKNIEEINVTGTHFYLSDCGGVANPAAALLRIRCGTAHIYDNYFEGEVKAIDGLFECGTSAGVLVDVQFNTFKGVTTYVHINDGKPVVFNNNLYLDANGVALSAAPATVIGNGVTADTKVFATEEERAAAYIQFTSATLYTVSYNLNGGAWNGAAGATSFYEGNPFELPTPVKEGYKFVGWFEGEDEVTELEDKNYELEAIWIPAGLYVGAGEYGEYETISEALAVAQDGDTIYVYGGWYMESFTITQTGLKLVGINGYGVDPNATSVSANDAYVNGKVTVAANDVEIIGMAFYQAAGITGNKIDNFKFLYNHVTSINQNSASWVETSVQTLGFLKLIGASDDQVTNTVIHGNTFDTVLDSCVFVYCPNGLRISENTFANYSYDAIRIDGGYSNGQVIITNNEIYTLGSNRAMTGIYFRAYSNYTSAVNPEIVYICYNSIMGVGYGSGTSVFKGAITARNNQEQGVQFIIKYNTFYDCYRYIRIRNQADDLNNFKLHPWSCLIENNQFYGEPTDFYFNNRNATDNGSANPSLTVIGANYYADLDYNTITVNPDMFVGTANTEFISLEQPPYASDKSNEIKFEIHYVAEGVTVQGTNKATIGANVTLPEVAKEGFFFRGWFDNAEFEGEAITEITNIGKDVTLYALFAEYEYNFITYHTNEGTLPEGAPNQYVVGIGIALPTPTKENCNFLGWYDNAQCTGTAITAIGADATGDVELYALWQDLTAKYDLTYNLNGGSLQYSNYEAVAADFLADMNAVNGTTEYTGANFESKVRNAQFTAFLADDAMWTKWSWLFAYMQANDKNGSSVAIYDEVMTSRTCLNANWWFLTRDFSGFVNKKVGNFYYSVSPMDWTSYDLSEGIWACMPQVATAEQVQALATPVRPYYTFLGWYDNVELSGNPVNVLYKNETLYAKWEKTTVKLTYVLNNADATLAQTEVNVHAGDSFDLATPTFNAKYWVFDGWFKDQAFTQPITEIKEFTTAPVTVYAKWTEIQGYTINYVLNGGSIKYASLQDVLADFIADYNAQMNKAYALDGSDIPTGAWNDIDYHTFYTKTLANGQTVRAKWLWLAEYLYSLGQRDLASNNCNNTGLKKLIQSDTPSYSGDDIYGISYAFRAFLAQSIVRPDSSYTSVDYRIYANAHGFWETLSNAENGTYLNNKGVVTLATANLENYEFAGWYDNPQLNGTPITSVDGSEDSYTFYAKYVEGTPVTSVAFTNVPEEMKQFAELQTTWEVLPADANIKSVIFSSSNNAVATINAQGYITAVAPGTATLTVKSDSASGVTGTATIVVYAPGHFEISYETESYVLEGEQIQLNAAYIKRDGTEAEVTMSIDNTAVATLNGNIVTGVAQGLAHVTASAEGETVEFLVTVVNESQLTAIMNQVLDAHQSNAFTRYNLGIGAGTPAYYRDIIGSVSTLLYNKPLVIDRTYEATQAGVSDNHGGTKSSTEFICVHYTGNMGKGSTAAANANYFAGGGGGTSIHYVTGNDGVFSALDDSLVGFHAGDGTGTAFNWYATGVMYEEGDPTYPVWGISSDSYFTINGKKTTRPVPTGSTEATLKVTDARWINKMGLAFKVQNGQYYMGTTWWCYSQIAEGRICSHGGNLNSIGIESAVNPESDLWLTWQMTAQLVAKLMKDNNLDITRVVGHHFFTAKDCPQPLLENDLEIWWEFIEMVKDNYEMITTFKDYQVAMTVGSQACVNNNGRISLPEYATVVTYQVTVTTPGGQTETITLGTAVNGQYSK